MCMCVNSKTVGAVQDALAELKDKVRSCVRVRMCMCVRKRLCHYAGCFS